MKLQDTIMIPAHTAAITCDCGAPLPLDSSMYAGKVEVTCVQCHKTFWLEIIDRQGEQVVYCWTVESEEDLMKALTNAVDALIAEYGLKAVYYDVRKRDGFCKNCGTPLSPEDVHHPWGGSLGSCTISKAVMDTGGGEDNGE